MTELTIGNFIKTNISNIQTRNRNLKVNGQIKFETNLREREETYLNALPSVTKEQFINYYIKLMETKGEYVSPTLNTITNSVNTRMKDLPKSRYRDVVVTAFYDFNVDMRDIYQKNERQRRRKAMLERMKSKTYEHAVCEHFIKLSTKEVKHEPKRQVTQKTERKSVLNVRLPRLHNDNRFDNKMKDMENGEIMMIMDSAGGFKGAGYRVVSIDDVGKLPHIKLSTASPSSCLRKEKFTKIRIGVPTYDMIANASYVIVHGGRIVYHFDGAPRLRIIEHWVSYLFPSRKSSIVFRDRDEQPVTKCDDKGETDDEGETDNEGETDDEGEMEHEGQSRNAKHPTKKKTIGDRKFSKGRKLFVFKPPDANISKLLDKLLEYTPEPIDIKPKSNDTAKSDFYKTIGTTSTGGGFFSNKSLVNDDDDDDSDYDNDDGLNWGKTVWNIDKSSVDGEVNSK